MFFKKLFSSSPARGAPALPAAREFPLETEERLNALHGRAPIDRHLRILFKGARVGEHDFAGLYRQCLKETGTAVTPFNVFQRFQSRLNLVQYFSAALEVPGARVECGVYRGATALLLCHAWRSHEAGFNGENLYLIDSFAGSSASGEHDLIPVRGDHGARMESFFPEGKTDIDAALVRSFFGEFPRVTVCAGFIPHVLAKLPEQQYSFVHLDVTLYEPTLSALEYFYSRMNPGGIILCDDYGSIFCPGAQKAWDEFCDRSNVPFIVLGSRQSVIIR